VWFDNEEAMKDLQNAFDEKGVHEVKAIVVKDLCKGVVSRAVIRWLKSRFTGVPWFISTKEWKPDWALQELKGEHVQLLLIPQVTAGCYRRRVSAQIW
jgi:hypothetical protein